MNSKKTLQLALRLDPDSWHGMSSESIWTSLVQPLGDRTDVKAIMEVDCIPFFSKDLSLGDKLCVDFNTGVPTIEAVIERGGHSTYRIFIDSPTTKASGMLSVLEGMGCSRVMAKISGGKLYALDIPPDVDLDEAYQILESGQREGLWLFEEGYVGHPPKGHPTPALS